MSLVAPDLVEQGVTFAKNFYEANQGFMSYGHVYAALIGGTVALLGVLVIRKGMAYYQLRKGKRQMGLSKKTAVRMASSYLADKVNDFVDELEEQGRITQAMKYDVFKLIAKRHKVPDLLPRKIPCAPPDLVKARIRRELGTHTEAKLPDAVEHPVAPPPATKVVKKLDVGALLARFKSA